MGQNENFEDIIRGKFAQRQITPDAAHAESVKNLIKARHAKRKRRGFILIFFALFVIGIAVMIPFVAPKDSSTLVVENKIKPVAATENSSAVTPEIKTEVGQKENTNASPAKSVSEEKAPETKIAENVNSESKKRSVSTNVEKKNETKKAISPVAVSPIIVKKEVQGEDTKIPVVINVVKKENIKPIATKKSKQKEKNENPVSKTEVEQTKKETPAEVVATQPQKTEIKNETKVNSANTNSVSNSDSAKTTITNQSIATNVSITQTATDTTAKTIKTPPVVLKDSIVKKPDSAATADFKTPVKIQRKNMLFIEAGTGFASGWNNQNTIEGQGFNPIFGVGYSHAFSSTWSIQTGIQGTTIGYLNSSEHTITNTNNGFGYNASDSVISTNWLYYATVPVQLNYHFNSKNSFGLGGTVSYLVNGSGKLTTYNQSDDYGMTGKKIISQTGYVKGFSTLNTTIMLVYRRKLSDRFSGSLIPYVGLTDIKNNSFFSVQKFERDMGIKLLLSYNLFK